MVGGRKEDIPTEKVQVQSRFSYEKKTQQDGGK